jgi:type IV pilus assembly protein PilA
MTQQQSPPELSKPPISALAVVSLVTSLIGAHLVGIITGHIALSRVKKLQLRGHGLALAGVIIGYIGFVFVVIVSILAAIAIPIFAAQQAAARDAAVESDLVNLKVSIVSQLVADPYSSVSLDPMGYPDFTPSDDSLITIVGDNSAFCLSGSSIANGPGATTFATSDVSPLIEGTCVGAIATPGGAP